MPPLSRIQIGLFLLLGFPACTYAQLHLTPLFSNTGKHEITRRAGPELPAVGVKPLERLEWAPVIRKWLQPWAETGISVDMVDLAHLALKNTTHVLESEYQQGRNPEEVLSRAPIVPYLRMLPVVWRAQIVAGRLYVLDIYALRPGRETTPGPKLLLLEMLRRHPEMPDVDIVVTQWDNPVASSSKNHQGFWDGGPANAARRESVGPVPVFSPSTGAAWLDLPLPDFTFMFPRDSPNRLGTERWEDTHAKVLAAGHLKPFAQRVGRAAFSGNCGQSDHMHRPTLKRLARAYPELMFVSDVNKGDKDRGGAVSCVEKLGPDGMKGAVEGMCSMSYAELCAFKYLLSASTGGSFSGRLKYLFLTGAVVIHVEYRDRVAEFYQYLLEPGVHYISVTDPEQVPEKIRWLEAHPEEAQAMAEAGRALIERLTFDEVLEYTHDLLSGYAALQRDPVVPHPDAVHFNCEDDFYRYYSLLRFVRGDNSTCVEAVEADWTDAKGRPHFDAPGYGGAFTGRTVPCTAENTPEWPMEHCHPSCAKADRLSVVCEPGREPYPWADGAVPLPKDYVPVPNCGGGICN